MNPNWSAIPGKCTQIDVSPADVTWGVNSRHHIYMRSKSGNGWLKVGGGLTHVTVGHAGVWGVNIHKNIYYREGITLSSLVGSSWTQIPGNNIQS